MTSPAEPATATVVASATSSQAVTSSMAAQAIVSAPSGRLSIRRSTRIRASTGKAVTDMETPMKSAKAMNFVSGPTSSNTGTAATSPSTIGSTTLALEIAAAWPTRPRSCAGSSSSPTRNM